MHAGYYYASCEHETRDKKGLMGEDSRFNGYYTCSLMLALDSHGHAKHMTRARESNGLMVRKRAEGGKKDGTKDGGKNQLAGGDDG